MNKERVSIHISDSAQIFIEQTIDGVKVTKSAQLDDILLCLQSSIKPAASAYSAVLPPNTLFYSHLTDTDAYSVALEYPYNTADITYMETEYPDFPLPKLVFGFKVNRDGKIQAVYSGVTENCTLREDTPMYFYPLSNVDAHNFQLCTGDNELPEISSPYLLGNIMDYILGLPNNDDHFHREYNRPELCQRELMDHLSDKSPEYYYSDILIPSGKTLADFYREVSL